MKNLYKNKREEGFTIIEVLIVLAIAGLIMLIVFLAVPALQRNQRNNARNNDASRLAAAVSECLANHNGQNGSCINGSALQNVDFANPNQLTTAPAAANGGTTAPASGLQQAGVWLNRECTSDGSGSQASTTGTRTFAILYTLEPSVTRCISS